MEAPVSAYQSSSGTIAVLCSQHRSLGKGISRGSKDSDGPRRSWLVSKVTGQLSLSQSPDSLRLKLILKEHCLVDQDLFHPGETAFPIKLRLLSPVETGTGSWLLLLLPQAPCSKASEQYAPAATGPSTAAGLVLPATTRTVQSLPAICFRFNSVEAGAGFKLLLQTILAAETQAQAAEVVQASGGAAFQTAETAFEDAAAWQHGLTAMTQGQAATELDPMTFGSAEMSSCDRGLLKAQIRACLLDPSFHGLVSAVEEAWTEMEGEVDNM